VGRKAAALALSLLPAAAHADVLTFGIWPTFYPADSVSCLVALESGQVKIVEIRGVGMPPRHPMRWPVRRPEEQVILSALQAFIAGDLPSIDSLASRQPPAPYVTVNWASEVNGVRVGGLYLQTGLDLPDVLKNVLNTVIPSSKCMSVTD
jgi:hypothetical protein